MVDDNGTLNDAGTLVVHAEDGAYHAVPWAVIAQYRVTGEHEAVAATLLTAEVQGHVLDGIGRLIAVTPMKVQNANDQALLGAEQQRPLVHSQTRLRPVRAVHATSGWPS